MEQGSLFSKHNTQKESKCDPELLLADRQSLVHNSGVLDNLVRKKPGEKSRFKPQNSIFKSQSGPCEQK